ncbi:MAG: hypothetical protein ABFR75_11110 [Acidobacteriota bacterium]
MKKSALVIVLSFFIFTTADFIFPQKIDLVELQKKEKKRREKIKKAKYKITNDNVTSTIKTKKNLSFIKVDNETTGEKLKEKKKAAEEDPKKKEEYWRRKMKIINENIDTTKKNIEKTKSNLNQAQTNFLIADIPGKINQARALVDELTKLLEEHKIRLSKFEKDKEALYNEARKAGALPGWLR